MNTPIRSIAHFICFSLPFSAWAAEISIEDISVPVGTQSVSVPILIEPTAVGETVGAMNISFAAGSSADAIHILGTGLEFDGSIWDSGSFFPAAGTPKTHSVLSAVAMLDPLQISTDGTLVTYTLDTSSLPAGAYELNPNFQIEGTGTSSDANVADVPTGLSFITGTLTIGMPQVLTGDYNGSGGVEQGDLDLVLLNWGEPGVPANWVNDLPSGNIDQGELDGVLLNWGETANQLGGQGVPEPASVLIAVVAGVGLYVWRRLAW